MSVHEESSAFDQWYNGLVGFHINSERILDDLGVPDYDAHLVEKWMKVCWNNALEAAMNSVVEDYGYDDNQLLLSGLKATP